MGESDCNTDLNLGIQEGSDLLQNRNLNLTRPSVETSDVKNASDGVVQSTKKGVKRVSEKARKEGDIDLNLVNNYDSRRKKAKFTEEQCASLESSFEEQSSLTMEKKKELSEKLGMKERQVEVWFQNRRARNKIKQVEGDCESWKKLCDDLKKEKEVQHESWKKHCENLKEENQNLKMEVVELKAIILAISSPLQVPDKGECPISKNCKDSTKNNKKA